MTEPTTIPAARVPLVDSTGLVSREWYRYFINQFDKTGGGIGTTTISSVTTTISLLAAELDVSMAFIPGQYIAPVSSPDISNDVICYSVYGG